MHKSLKKIKKEKQKHQQAADDSIPVASLKKPSIVEIPALSTCKT